MNNTLKFFFLLSLTFIQTACKHDHQVSPQLQEAMFIHIDAVEEGKKAKNALDSLPLEASVKEKIKNKIEVWEKSAVEIEGMDGHHDHHGHDHSNHNHNTGYHLTDEEMVSVQKAWKDSITLILENMYNAQIN